MDRDDARFAADAIEAKLHGFGDVCDELAGSSLVRLMGIAQVLRKNAAAWAPAHAGAVALEAIARHGRQVVDLPADDDEKIIVDSLRKLADEPRNRHSHSDPIPRIGNRANRRKAAKILLPRRERLSGSRNLLTAH